MANKKVFGVLLTDLAWNDLEKALAPYASEGSIGKYIYCKQVHSDAPYFIMVAKYKNHDGTSFEAEISIPHHYIKLCISASEKSLIGFMRE
ncbi:MAG: hypothetical protein ABI604_17490 [Nitrospirota bacterium]